MTDYSKLAWETMLAYRKRKSEKTGSVTVFELKGAEAQAKLIQLGIDVGRKIGVREQEMLCGICHERMKLVTDWTDEMIQYEIDRPGYMKFWCDECRFSIYVKKEE